MSLFGTVKVAPWATFVAETTVALAGRIAEKAEGVQSNAYAIGSKDRPTRGREEDFMIARVTMDSTVQKKVIYPALTTREDPRLASRLGLLRDTSIYTGTSIQGNPVRSARYLAITTAIGVCM